MLIDVCAGRKAQEIVQDTWGHLRAEEGQSYKGYMIYAHSTYGDIVLLDSYFENLNDSPWLFEAMQDYIAENGEHGHVYRWDGYYKVSDNGNSRFDGKIKKLTAEQALKGGGQAEAESSNNTNRQSGTES